MFTGIVEELGTVTEITPQTTTDGLTDAVRVTVQAEKVLTDVHLGDSIAVNGCCLTVSTLGNSARGDSARGDSARGESTWTADVMQQTLDLTTLGSITPGSRVNLERAVTAGTRLGGHLVQGHVDGVGTVISREPSEHWDRVTISTPKGMTRYLVDQGSVTVDGVSLTVAEAGNDQFTVSLIPETLARTTLGLRAVGERVNLEVDVIAKYVERLMA